MAPRGVAPEIAAMPTAGTPILQDREQDLATHDLATQSVLDLAKVHRSYMRR